jgi:serine/threonine protein kinase
MNEKYLTNNPYISLFKYGIPYYGPFNGIKYLTSAWVPKIENIHTVRNTLNFPDNINDSQNDIEEYTRITNGSKSTRRFIKENHEFTGSYGIVDRIECYESNINQDGNVSYTVESLFRKKSKNNESLLYEACFQIISRHILTQFNLEDTIADIKDIICYDDNSIGFTMVPFKHMKFLSDVLLIVSEEEIITCICKITFILYILSEELGFNHRDLKGNNILISQLVNISPIFGSINYINNSSNIKEKMQMKYNNLSMNVLKYPNVHFVDFGFSCSGNGSSSEISATNYFSITHPCPKKGRDIFLLLTYIYITINIRNESIVKYIEELLEVPGKDYPKFLREHGEERLDWVYFLIGSSNFKAPKCEPLHILHFFANKYPHIIQLQHTS